MIELFSLRLQNTHFFKDTEFRLARKGISIIHGLNLNTSNRNPNAAGKSLFFSQLPELIFGTPVIGNSRDRLRRGTITLKLAKEERGERVKYVITRSTSKGEKITVTRNGKDLGIHKLVDARAYVVDNIFSTNDAEFQTLCYLDTRVPHPLVLGGSGPRRDFFTRFFRLDTVDGIRRLVAAKIDEIKANKLLYTELVRQFKEKRDAQLTAEDYASKKEWIAKAEAHKEALGRRIRRASEIRALMEMRELPNYARLLKMCEGDFESFPALRGFLNNDLQTAKLRVKIARKYSDYKRDVAAVAEARRHLLTEIYELWGDEGAPTGPQVREKMKERKELDQQGTDLSERASLARMRVQEHLRDIRRNELLVDEVKASLRELGDQAVCPTCGQPVTGEQRDKLDARRSKLKVKGRELKTQGLMLESKLEKAQGKLDDLNREIKVLANQQQQYTKYEQTARLLDKMPDRPEAFDGERLSEDDEREKLDRLSSRMDFLESCEPMLKSFQAAFALTDEDVASSKEEDALRVKLDALTTRITEVTLQVEKHKFERRAVRELVERIKSLREDIANEEAYGVLDDAFSRKGIQSLMIRSICGRLEQVINKYAKLVFPEDYRFTFELDTQFNILVHRAYGKDVTVSDVRKLSGAESKLFSLLLLIGLMTFVPKAQRVNTLILDEPTAAMGPEMADAFARFLPVLNKVIPHIIVITPRTEDRYEGASVFTVVKKGNRSRIVEGSDV